MPRRHQKRRKTRTRRDTAEESDTEEMHSNCPSTLFSRGTDDSSNSSRPQSPQVNQISGRRFDPAELYPKHFTLDDIQVPWRDRVFLACPGSPRKCPDCNRHVSHTDCIVIAIDGACRNNGRYGARASVGVYHGYNNGWNESNLLPPEENQTNQVAELVACERALIDAQTIQNLWEEGAENGEDRGGKLSMVVIKSDSEYVVRGMTEWLSKWKANGWINAKGLPVTNREYFRGIECLVESLEEKQVSVKFWHVPREFNQDADQLAKSALFDD
ncbi:ribonuclease H-like protein [Aspergillus sclerotiicarbonarius CBS 121057]|uniref:ribonuclease H n=1 Tax=Aspergillus sclerotiicarbonarius (strain CBS 121057 / IBT 28362) TaxID=1448318 RepID=A0A319EK05_ASPSB|nr:ribonuclease H-like protein [Aspergillus sclerotiicarbonarius CBS 121057]